MLSDVPRIVVRNQSKLSKRDAWVSAWALGYQIRWQFGPLWKIGADVELLPGGIAVPSGAWIIDLLNQSDQENALGYHDEDENEVPYGRVFVKSAEEAGLTACEVLSHEGMELLVDPHVNLTSYDPTSRRLYAAEVGDPVQGGAYDLAEPMGRPPVGCTMADFILPNWLDPNTPSNAITDYRRTIRGPFSLGLQGYVSFTTELPPSWQQEVGEDANPRRIDADDRVQRRRLRAAA